MTDENGSLKWHNIKGLQRKIDLTYIEAGINKTAMLLLCFGGQGHRWNCSSTHGYLFCVHIFTVRELEALSNGRGLIQMGNNPLPFLGTSLPIQKGKKRPLDSFASPNKSKEGNFAIFLNCQTYSKLVQFFRQNLFLLNTKKNCTNFNTIARKVIKQSK